MEEMSEKTKYDGQDKKGKKMKVEFNLVKNGGIFILLGGLLVTALLSSTFRKQRKSENHRGSPSKSVEAEEAAEEENGEENNISDDEDQVRKGLQFILSEPSSLMQDHVRIKDGEGDYNVSEEMNGTAEKDETVLLKVQGSEEQDSPVSGCHQEIISNDSSIPGSATSSEQEYSSLAFNSHPLFDQANMSNGGSEEGTLHTEDFEVTNVDEEMEAALEEEVKEIADVLPAEQEEMECSEKFFSPENEMDFCEGVIETHGVDKQNAMNSSLEMQMRIDEHRGVGDDNQKNTTSDQLTSEITHLEDCEVNNVQNLELAAIHVSSHIKPEIEINHYTEENQHSDEVYVTTEENADSNEPASGEQNLEEDIPIPTVQFVEKQHCDDYCKDGTTMVDEKALGHSSRDIAQGQKESTMILSGKEREEVAGNGEEKVSPSIQFVENKLCKDDYTGDIATGKKYPIYPSNDKEGEEIDDDDDECDYDDGDDDDDDISEETEESFEGAGISSDKSDGDGAIWSAEPVQGGYLRGLQGLNVKEAIEEDGKLKAEGHINFKTINSSMQQTSDYGGDLKMNSIQSGTKKLAILDSLVTYSSKSKRRILAETVTLLIAYSCFWYFGLPFLKPSLVVIAAMALSKLGASCLKNSRQ